MFSKFCKKNVAIGHSHSQKKQNDTLTVTLELYFILHFQSLLKLHLTEQKIHCNYQQLTLKQKNNNNEQLQNESNLFSAKALPLIPVPPSLLGRKYPLTLHSLNALAPPL